MNYEYVKITDRVIRKTNVNCLDVSFHNHKKSLCEFLMVRGQSPTTSKLVIGSLPFRN